MNLNKFYRITIYLGFGLITFSMLAFEIIMNRLFSLMYWYHFAFMIISIALFGIGFGSMLVFFFSKIFKKSLIIISILSAFLLALTLPYILLLVNSIPLRMDLVGTDHVQNILFIKVFLILSSPFVFTGFVSASIFKLYKEKITKLYFFDLAGGGFGCLFTLLIFPHHGPFYTAFILGIIITLGASLLLFHLNKIISITLLFFVILFHINFTIPEVSNIVPMVNKSIRHTDIGDKKNVNKALEKLYGKIVFTDWDNSGYVTVHSNNPNRLLIIADYSCFSDLNKVDKSKNIESLFLPFYVDNLYPYMIKRSMNNVGIIGVGGGKDVIGALHYGTKNIYGAELNNAIYNIFEHRYKEYLGNIPDRTNVHIVNNEGRFFIRSASRKYNALIFDNAVSSMAVASGAFTLAEHYLYSIEAMKDYIEHLSKDGIIYFSNPIIDADRFITTIREVFKQLKIERNFPNCIFIADNLYENYRKCKILVKPDGFDKNEIKTINRLTLNIKHKILYTPSPDHTTNNLYLQNLITTKNIQEVYDKSPLELRPATDNWPFFTQRVKPNFIQNSKELQKVEFFYPEPFIFLKNTTKYLMFFSFIFLLLPMLVFNLKGFSTLKNKLSNLIYFICLGLGFIFMEIILIQKYILILGYPVYSFGIVTAGLLLSSGFGSLLSNRFTNPKKATYTGLIGILIGTLITIIFLKYFSLFIIGQPFWKRIIISLLLISLNGIFMGFMFPSGIRLISNTEESIPWMYSINSIFSVTGSYSAIILSILFGFNFVLFLVIGLYIIAGLSRLFIKI